ncbi:MAG: GerW family sporulation protein [Bacillota bacterium]|jgi:sporulation protein YtfJ
MSGHPIESLMRTTMESLKSMVDVNTVVGEPVETKEGVVIIPVSKVSFGFVSGGGDEAPTDNQDSQFSQIPFTGGTGAGVSVAPVGFLVVGSRKVRFLPVTSRAIYDRILDEAPDLLEKLSDVIRDRRNRSEHDVEPRHGAFH